MKEITIYTRHNCPYCTRAKMLLESKGAKYNEINIGEHPEERETMIKRSNGGKTFPQIFIGDTHIGGCDDLYALESSNRLESLLK